MWTKGPQPSDDPDSYGPSSVTSTPVQPTAQPAKDSSTLDGLIQNSRETASLSGEYRYGKTSPLKVRAHEMLKDAQIKREGEKVASGFFQDANECDFFYKPPPPAAKGLPARGARPSDPVCGGKS